LVAIGLVIGAALVLLYPPETIGKKLEELA